MWFLMQFNFVTLPWHWMNVVVLLMFCFRLFGNCKSDCKTMWSFQEDLIEINNSHLGCETHIHNHWLRKLDCNWIFSEMEPLWQPAPVSAVATFVLTYLPMVLLTESVVHVTFEKHFLCLFLFVSLSLSGRSLCWRIIRWSRRCGGSGGGFSAAGEQRASLKHFQHCGNHLLLHVKICHCHQPTLADANTVCLLTVLSGGIKTCLFHKCNSVQIRHNFVF